MTNGVKKCLGKEKKKLIIFMFRKVLKYSLNVFITYVFFSFSEIQQAEA